MKKSNNGYTAPSNEVMHLEICVLQILVHLLCLVCTELEQGVLLALMVSYLYMFFSFCFIYECSLTYHVKCFVNLYYWLL
jgi:hypothetical protein